jgi:hypothetical protein
MRLIKHSVSALRLPSLMPRSMMLVASAVAVAVSGTAFAGEPEAKDLFVDNVMRVQAAHVASRGQPVPLAERLVYESAQDQFVDQVLRGRFPEIGLTGRIMSAASNNPPSWPDIGFLRVTSPR